MSMAPASERSQQIRTILTEVVRLSRVLASPRSTLFGEVTLTRTQVDILFLLAHGSEPFTPGRLADILQVTRGAITQTVEHLRAAGLVQQKPAEHDGRARVLCLTDPARKQVDAFETALVVGATPWFGDLSDDELVNVATSLSRVSGAP